MSRSNPNIGERSFAHFRPLTNRITSEIQTVLFYREQLQVEVRDLQDQVEALRAQLVNLRKRVAQEQDELDHFNYGQLIGCTPLIGRTLVSK